MPKVALAAICVTSFVYAQDRFEVASVKLNDASIAESPMRLSYQQDRFIARNFPLISIITDAYELPANLYSGLLSGAPAWVNTERYDIEAIAELPAGLSVDQLKETMAPMLRVLLQERFSLSMRVNRVEMSVYAIEVNTSGLRLSPAETEKDCAAKAGSEEECHRLRGSLREGMHGRAVSMDDVAKFIQSYTDRPVVDKSGITGLFTIDTTGWRPMNAPVARRAGAGAGDEELPNLFEVVEKLGLKLVADKALVDSYVVESIRRPTEN